MVVVVLPTPPFWLAMAMIRGVAFGPPGVVVALGIRRTEYPQLSQGWGMMFHVEHWLSRAESVIGGGQCSTWNIATGPSRSGLDTPNKPRLMLAQRSGLPGGGSLTTIDPPERTNAEAQASVC